MARPNARMFTCHFTMFHRPITPRAGHSWWIKNARRDSFPYPAVEEAFALALCRREVADEEGPTWLIPWINSWSAGFPPALSMQPRPRVLYPPNNGKDR